MIAWVLFRLAVGTGDRRPASAAASLALGAALYAGAGLVWALTLALGFGYPPLSALGHVLWPPSELWRLGLWPLWVADRLGLFSFRLS